MTSVPGAKKTIAVLGAGISGLAFAHRIRELSQKSGVPVDLTVLDAAARCGGSIRTERRDGFLLEHGPDSFLSEKPHALELAARLGLKERVLGTRPEFARTFVARNGRLHGLPEGFYLIAPRNAAAFARTPLFSVSGKLRALAESFVPARNDLSDESVAGFIRRRFGTEMLERVGQPMIAGVYSGDPDRLSMLSTMPRFPELEKTYGSVLRGLRKRSREDTAARQARGPRYTLFQTFEEGMQTLTDSLERALGPGTFRPGFRAAAVLRHGEKWRVRSVSDEEVDADALCLALPAAVSARLLASAAPVLSGRLSQLRNEFVATLNLAFEHDAIRHPLDGFGFVVPRLEKSSLMACTFVHRKFAGRAPQRKVLLRAFVGGAFGHEYLDRGDARLVEDVLRDLGTYLGVRSKPLFAQLTRYPNSLPQYEVGHRERVSAIEKETAALGGLILTGASFRGTGIPDCVRDAEACAGRLWEVV